MNELEIALDTIKQHDKCRGCIGNCTECEFSKAMDIIESVIYEYPELKERATPKEGIDVYNTFGDGTLSCPLCNKPIVNVWSKLPYMPNYCHHCGQRFKWSRSEE